MLDEKFIINKYLGIPFLHGGRTLNGLDCWGLIIAIYADLGFKLLDIEEEYTPDWQFKNKNYFIENYCKEWKRATLPELFDGVLFKSGKNIANHAGVVLSDNRFIHTCKAGTIISRLDEWKNKIEGFYHLKAR